MGLFRFLLAASVLTAHSSAIPGLPLLDAGLAVKTFFIISGFYMQLILDSKYSRVENGIRLFYTNRALRIYPMYLLTLVLAVLFYLAASIKLGHPADRLIYWVQGWRLHDFLPLSCIAVSQVAIFGLDTTPLFFFSPTAGFHLMNQPVPVGAGLAWRFNFLPHCWSIAAELFFYSLMPLLNLCRTRWLIALCFLGATSRAVADTFWPTLAGPMNYHFGPMQLYYFILGILAYRMVYKGVLKSRPRTDWRLLVPIVLLVAMTFNPVWISTQVPPVTHEVMRSFYTLLAALCVPVLFHLTKVVAWDRWIGELSYPMYLLHIPMKWVLLAKSGVSQKDEAVVSGVQLLLLTVSAAFLMTYFIDRPVEAFRQRRFERNKERTAEGLEMKSSS